MGRRWIGVEMGDHARTHCALRLEKVIDGEQGGISKKVGWEGGGGFRFCTSGAAGFDADGRIDPDIRFTDLARHVWFAETRRPLTAAPVGPVLGAEGDRAVALLYNGVLKDRSPGGGNVLTRPVLGLIRSDLGGARAGVRRRARRSMAPRAASRPARSRRKASCSARRHTTSWRGSEPCSSRNTRKPRWPLSMAS